MTGHAIFWRIGGQIGPPSLNLVIPSDHLNHHCRGNAKKSAGDCHTTDYRHTHGLAIIPFISVLDWLSVSPIGLFALLGAAKSTFYHPAPNIWPWLLSLTLKFDLDLRLLTFTIIVPHAGILGRADGRMDATKHIISIASRSITRWLKMTTLQAIYLIHNWRVLSFMLMRCSFPAFMIMYLITMAFMRVMCFVRVWSNLKLS